MNSSRLQQLRKINQLARGDQLPEPYQPPVKRFRGVYQGKEIGVCWEHNQAYRSQFSRKDQPGSLLPSNPDATYSFWSVCITLDSRLVYSTYIAMPQTGKEPTEFANEQIHCPQEFTNLILAAS